MEFMKLFMVGAKIYMYSRVFRKQRLHSTPCIWRDVQKALIVCLFGWRKMTTRRFLVHLFILGDMNELLNDVITWTRKTVQLRIVAELARKCVGLSAFDTLQKLTYVFDDIDSFSAHLHFDGEQMLLISVWNCT
ncbi:hypothetical protein D3C75_992240 [compost metagenome]